MSYIMTPTARIDARRTACLLLDAVAVARVSPHFNDKHRNLVEPTKKSFLEGYVRSIKPEAHAAIDAFTDLVKEALLDLAAETREKISNREKARAYYRALTEKTHYAVEAI